MTWQIRRPVAVAAAVAMVVLSGSPAPAAAVAGAPPVGTPALVHLTDAQALAADLETIAAGRGWTVAQARAQYDLAERVRPVHQAIAENAPEVFAGTVLPASPGGTARVLVKGAAPAFVRKTVAASGLPISIVEHQPYSLVELSARSDAVHDRLKALGYRSIATGVDVVSAKVDATVTAVPSVGVRPASILQRLPAGLRDGLDLKVVDAPVTARQTAMFGGLRTLNNANQPQCTTGFSVSQGGFVGVSTAAHCAQTQVDHNGARHQYNLFDEELGDFGDVEWGTTFGVPVVDDFFGGSTEVRDVTGVRALSAMMAGDQACVFGRTTGFRRCSTIFQFNVTVTDTRGTSRRHVAVTDNITLGGDSGAPWFVTTLAYGVHTGTVTLDRAPRSLFSPADLIDEALGVQIMR